MSTASMNVTLWRIAAATPESPIAVFKSNLPRRLDSCFAATLMTQAQIASKSKQLIGIFDRTMNPEWVKLQLVPYLTPVTG